MATLESSMIPVDFRSQKVCTGQTTLTHLLIRRVRQVFGNRFGRGVKPDCPE